MKTISCSIVLGLVSIVALAQEKPVAITEEPHHRLVLENEYTRVFHVVVPSKQSTLVHQHDLDYVSVQIGAAELRNEKTGAAPAEAKAEDGAVKFAKGGFAHKISILSEAPFENLTIEVKKGSTKAVYGASWAGVKPDSSDDWKKDLSVISGAAGQTNHFETDAVSARTYTNSGSGTGFTFHDEQDPRLLVALTQLHCYCGGSQDLQMKVGDVAWVPIGSLANVSRVGSEGPRIVMVSFK